jgi:hypothetical protein
MRNTRKLIVLGLTIVFAAECGGAAQSFIKIAPSRSDLFLSGVVLDAPVDEQRVLVRLDLANRGTRPVHIMGVSRTDCGSRSISEEPPFTIGPQESKQMIASLFVRRRTQDETDVPLIIFTNKCQLAYTFKIAGLPATGIPKLAPKIDL